MRPRNSAGVGQLVGTELCRHPDDNTALAMAEELIRQGAGKGLYKVVLKQFDGSVTEALPKLLTMLETMMEEHSGVAAYLMARLHARASRQKASAVQHAIDLWMNGLATDAAASALLVLANEASRPAQRRRCLEWADGISKRASLVGTE